MIFNSKNRFILTNDKINFGTGTLSELGNTKNKFWASSHGPCLGYIKNRYFPATNWRSVPTTAPTSLIYNCTN